jgi:hypothetical protein
VRRFGHISGKSAVLAIQIQFISFYFFEGGIDGDGGAGGVWFGNASGFEKSPDGKKSSSIRKAGNEERTVSGNERFIEPPGTFTIEAISKLPQVAKEVVVDGVLGWVATEASAAPRSSLWRLSASLNGLKAS